MDHHDTPLEARELPRRVADPFAVALDLDARPETLGEWVDLTGRRLDRAGVSVGADELCLTESSPHRVHVGGEVSHFACVLDTLLVPFVLDTSGETAVHTRSPVSGAGIAVAVAREGVTVDPGRAVMSFGIAADVEAPDDGDDVLASGGAQFCPYITAFVDEAEYDEWAARTPEAETIALSLAEGFALAKSLAGRLTT